MRKCVGCRLCVIIVALLAITSTAAKANVIQNGNFETGSFASWQSNGHVATASVPYFGAGGVAQDGHYVAVFNAGETTPNGQLWQSFVTQARTAYTVSFNYGETTAGDGSLQSITASALNGATLGGALLNNTAATAPNNASGLLSNFQFNFFANSTQTTLLFADTTNNHTVSLDGVLDNVSVTTSVVSEPASLAILGVSLVGVRLLRRTQPGKQHDLD